MNVSPSQCLTYSLWIYIWKQYIILRVCAVFMTFCCYYCCLAFVVYLLQLLLLLLYWSQQWAQEQNIISAHCTLKNQCCKLTESFVHKRSLAMHEYKRWRSEQNRFTSIYSFELAKKKTIDEWPKTTKWTFVYISALQMTIDVI